MKVQHFFDPITYTLSYIVFDEDSKDSILIDPVLDLDLASGTLSNESYSKIKNFINKNNLNLHAVLETHAHADHLSGAQLVKKDFPNIELMIGDQFPLVQKYFKEVFNMKEINSPFTHLLKDNEEISFGTIKIKAIHTPGHTPACMSYLVNNKFIFTGDALFMPDYGTGRCDFPMGSSEDLYNSVHEKIYKLDEKIEVFTGHDYQPNGRELRFKSTIGEQKNKNIQLKESTLKDEYINFRTNRDSTLNAPRLLLPSLQVNIQGGILPEVEDNNISYLKIPLKKKE